MAKLLHIEEKGDYVLLQKEEFEKLMKGTKTKEDAKLKKLLEEEYREMAEDSAKIAKDWETVDLENKE